MAGSLLACGALVGSTQTAAVASVDRLGDPPVVSVTMSTENGFSLPRTLRAGLVTFKVSSSEDTFHGFQGFSLKPGVSLEQVKQEVDDALSGDPAIVPDAIRALTAHITEIGGVSTTPHAPQAVTIPLTRGTYYFLDVATVNNPPLTPVYHEVRVVGDFKWSRIPRFTSVVGMGHDENHKPVFHAPSRMPAKGSFLAYATGHELHEAVLRPTLPGTTDAYIASFYDAVRAGTPRPPAPWRPGQIGGMQAISPGRWAIMHIDVPPGTYTFVCFVPSGEPPGWPHTYIGMHKVVTLH
jgi:hypothetical protein